MSLLSQSLRQSRFLKPLVNLAEADALVWFNESIFGKTLDKFKSMLPQSSSEPNSVSTILMWGLSVGLLLLLYFLTTASTSIIGITVLLLFGCCFLLWVFRASLRQCQLNGLDCAVGLFFLTAVISTGFSSYLSTSINGLMKFFVFFAGYCTFRFAVSRLPSGYLVLMWGLLILGFWQSVVGFFQYVHHVQPLATWVDPNINPELTMTRIFGTLQPSNPNLLAGFLTPTLALGLGFSLWYVRQGRWWMTLLMLVVASCIMVALVLTGSRGGYLAMGGIFFVFFAGIGHLLWHDESLKSKKYLQWIWLFLLVSGVLGVVAAVATSPRLASRVASIFAMRADSSISYRLNVYQSVWEMIKDNWLIGIGPGNATFKQVYGLYMVPGYNALGAYSVPLEIAAEQGIVGVCAFLLMVFTIVLRALFGLDSDVPIARKILTLTLFSAIVGSLVYGLFDTIWYRPSVNIAFWMMVAGFSYFSTSQSSEGSSV